MHIACTVCHYLCFPVCVDVASDVVCRRDVYLGCGEAKEASEGKRMIVVL